MRLFKRVRINKKKRKINLQRTLTRGRHSRRRIMKNLYKSNRRITILN